MERARLRQAATTEPGAMALLEPGQGASVRGSPTPSCRQDTEQRRRTKVCSHKRSSVPSVPRTLQAQMEDCFDWATAEVRQCQVPVQNLLPEY